MTTCTHCGQPITFRHVDGVVKPIHLDGNWCRGSLTDAPSSYWRPPSSLSYDYFVNPHARCPRCGDPVFYYENENGSKVYFDHLGPPWPKHNCIESCAKSGIASGQQKHIKTNEIFSKQEIDTKNKRKRGDRSKRPPYAWDDKWHIFLVYDIAFLEEHSKRYEYYALSGYVCDEFFSLIVIPSSHVRFNKDAPFFVRKVGENVFEVSTLIEQGSTYSYRVLGYHDIEDALKSRSKHLKTESKDLLQSETDKNLKRGEWATGNHYKAISKVKNKRCKTCKIFTKEYTYGTESDRGTVLMDVLAPPWVRHKCHRDKPAPRASNKWEAVTLLHLHITPNKKLSIRIKTSSGDCFRVIIGTIDFQLHPNMPLYVKKINNTSCFLSTITTGGNKKIYQHFVEGELVFNSAPGSSIE